MTIQAIPQIIAQSSAIRVFIHSTTSAGELPGININDEEASRAMLLAQQNDILIVPTSIETSCLEYFHGLGFNIDPQRIITVSGTTETPLPERLAADTKALEYMKKLVGNQSVILDSFTLCEREIRLTKQLTQLFERPVTYIGPTLAVSQKANRKDTARQLALDIGVPVAPGELVCGVTDKNAEELLKPAIYRQIKMFGQVVIKGVIGGAGSATFIIKQATSIDEIIQKIAQRYDNTDYLVEPLFTLNAAPNISVWIDPDNGAVSLVNHTDQRLSEYLKFGGSNFPSVAKCYSEIVNAAELLAKGLHKMAFSGWAGFDFAEYKDPVSGEYRFFFAEINARFNGGMYAKALFDVITMQQQKRKAPIPKVYITENLITSPITFSRLQTVCQDLLFDQNTGYGAVPFNPGRLQDGKVSFAYLAENFDQAKQLSHKMQEQFSTLSD